MHEETLFLYVFIVTNCHLASSIGYANICVSIFVFLSQLLHSPHCCTFHFLLTLDRLLRLQSFHFHHLKHFVFFSFAYGCLHFFNNPFALYCFQRLSPLLPVKLCPPCRAFLATSLFPSLFSQSLLNLFHLFSPIPSSTFYLASTSALLRSSFLLHFLHFPLPHSFSCISFPPHP